MAYLYFVIFLPINFLLLAKFMPHRKSYFWYEYFGLFCLPLLVTVALSYSAGWIAWVIFIVWCIIGPIFEACVGYTYLWLAGKHLWVYERAPLFNKTTSYLSILFWGFAGVVFWAVQRFVTIVLRQ
jgi:hypothetical protein